MEKFYDMHMHVFDLSHPNLSAFLFRKDLIRSVINLKLRLFVMAAPLLAFMPEAFIASLIKRILEKNPQIKNTLAFYENSLEYQFLLIDYYLKNPDNANDTIVDQNNVFELDHEKYNRIVLCPLSVDFGYKNIDQQGVYYNKAAKKPMGKQVSELYSAIQSYYKYNLSPSVKSNHHPAELDLDEIVDWQNNMDKKLFEIYPFMGLNTQHYNMEELTGKSGKEGLLDKYFKDFDGTESNTDRKKRLYDKIGTFDGNMYNPDVRVFKNIFAGIKVYPQLGFNPYPNPVKEKDEFDKVKYLYDYCIDKRIPIITHCSDGGFEVDDFDDFTNPANQWSQVIDEFPEITLCFAHFGCQRNGATDWQNKIIELIKPFNNIYTDISCNDSCKNDKTYEILKKVIARSPKLEEKIMFGSDFSIGMLVAGANSYNQYLKKYIESDLQPYKQKLCRINTEQFLFSK